MPPQSQEPEIHLLEKLVTSAVDADKKIESANKGELQENGGKTLEKYFIMYMLTSNKVTYFKISSDDFFEIYSILAEYRYAN